MFGKSGASDNVAVDDLDSVDADKDAEYERLSLKSSESGY
jgi:hypothetical protein